MTVTISKWWESLGSEGQSWFLISGFVALFVIGLVVGIVVVSNVALLTALEPLAHLGFSAALVGVLGAFVTTMVRLG